jgi:transglycosylase-like protein
VFSVRVNVCLLAFSAVMTAVFALPRDADARAVKRTVNAIEAYRSATWRWERLMGTRLTPSTHFERRATGIRHLDRLEELWARRARAARRRAARPPHASAWRCIKRHESHPQMGWATRTGNGYYGGLQMDLGFQRRYGSDLLRRKGTADRWTPLEQMWVAERALRSGRGFFPWPNTAQACGLL